jgi:hypothetical protein
MSWQVCIPSYKRAEILTKKTLKTLLQGGVPVDRVTVYVADEGEATEYRARIGGKLPDDRIVVGRPGLAAQRQFIQDSWPVGTHLVFIDDDISQIKRLSGTRLERVTDIPEFLDGAFVEMEKAGASIWGVYPAASALYMSHTVNTALCYLIGALYGVRNTRGPTLRYGDNQEDKERTLRYWQRDGVICRLNHVTILTRYYGPGGMDSPTRKADTKAATQQLVDEFPGLITQTYKTKQGIHDIKFKRLTPSRTLPPGYADTRIDVLPVPDGYEAAREDLLSELRKIRIPTLGRPTAPHRRATHGTRADQIGSIGRTVTLGYGNTRRNGTAEFAANAKWPAVLRALIKFGNLIVPEGWVYTSITLNHGVQAKKHRDGNNTGKSIIVGIGDYTGGELRVWDANDENPQDWNLKDRPTLMNGALLPHETQPFTGERYTIIYYQHKHKGTCKDMPPMVGAPKSAHPVVDAACDEDTGDADEGVPDELSGGCDDDTKIHVV